MIFVNAVTYTVKSNLWQWYWSLEFNKSWLIFKVGLFSSCTYWNLMKLRNTVQYWGMILKMQLLSERSF